jgi:NAD(P)-dependent dehydrogenase (short-subunit alcohol dehydrogenase family)
MNRMGVPEEIAEAVVWMCSDKASFMTGRVAGHRRRIFRGVALNA